MTFALRARVAARARSLITALPTMAMRVPVEWPRSNSAGARVSTFEDDEERFVVLTVPLEDSSCLGSLTPAEREVAALAVAGWADGAIAASRGTSSRTIANQMASIRQKLGIQSRYELAVRMARTTVRAKIGLEHAALQTVRARAVQVDAESGFDAGIEAGTLWPAVADGTLRLAHRFDEGRRRYFVMLQQGADSTEASLDSRERYLAERLGNGECAKAAASDLGLTASAAFVLLKTTLAKLGLPSRFDLVLLMQSFAGKPRLTHSGHCMEHVDVEGVARHLEER